MYNKYLGILTILISALFLNAQDFSFNEFVDTWEGVSTSESNYAWNTDITIEVQPTGYYSDSSDLLMPPYYYPDTQMCEYDAYSNRLHFWYLNTVYAGQYFYSHSYFEVVNYDGYNLELHYNFWDDPEPHPDVWTISLTRSGGVPEGVLEGIVVDLDSYFPLEGILISTGEMNTETDEYGNFNMQIEQGSYDVLFSHPGYEDMIYYGVNIQPGAQVDLQVSMQHLYEPPTDLSYQIYNSTVTMEWNSPPGPGLTEYRVYRDYQFHNSTSNLYYIENELPPGTYFYYIVAVYGEIESEPSEMVQVIISGTDNSSDQITSVTVLEGNYPNPFNPQTTINFNLSESSPVELSIFNVKGEKVRSLINGTLTADNYNIIWNGRDDSNRKLAGGVYMYKLKAGVYTSTRKMIMLK